MIFFRPIMSTPRSHLPRQFLPSDQHRSMSTLAPQRVFQLKLNPLTGNSEWVVVNEDDEYEDEVKTSKPLLASTSYLDMINDERRNRTYRQAIEKTITNPCSVLDIGAGTGLLSLMAARAMKNSHGSLSDVLPGTVTACEAFLPMLKLLKKVLHENEIGRNIKIVYKRSDELQVGVDIPSRADVLVTEILDSELLGEGVIPTLRHAHDFLLTKNAKVVPYRAVTYGQLVESELLLKMHNLHGCEAQTTDGVQLVPLGLDHILRIEHQQYPIPCNGIVKYIKPLSEPFKVFEFDFWRRPESCGETEINIRVTNQGRVHAIVSWWVLQLDDEGEIFYSTAPSWIKSPLTMRNEDFCDHWKQCVWFVPGNGIPISSGKEIMLHASHSETKISYTLESSPSDEMNSDFMGRDFSLSLPSERIAILGDNKWRSSISKALKNQFSERVPTVCVVADDSLFLPILAAQISSTTRIISFLPGFRELGNEYLKNVAKANGLSSDRIKVFHHKKLLEDERFDQKIDMLVAEPYYYGNDNMLPWQSLRFWNDRTKLQHLLAEDATIMPCKAILKGCAMSLPELWRSRCSLSKVEGFDHSSVNKTMGACGNLEAPEEGPILPYFIWQCGHYAELTSEFSIMEFDFSTPIAPCKNKIQTCFLKKGTCHGFVLWMDWVMDEKQKVILSSGPDKMFWKQGVKLVSEPVAVGLSDSNSGEFHLVTIESFFDPLSGDLTIKHLFI